ncbi:hypothetical protein QJS10_CPA03g01264 [Acorus calamus]|uniref:Uncharacterized protein n=1 Tax=Acorus calamus TaxID=4465 RepID=A0AAV9FAP5_ACOCL|nr:hypothetical protein QJS10_CPA03g01264 [Acorus calamus]
MTSENLDIDQPNDSQDYTVTSIANLQEGKEPKEDPHQWEFNQHYPNFNEKEIKYAQFRVLRNSNVPKN